MDVSSSVLLHGLVGGLLIGAGAAVLVACNGRVAGISGITANVAGGLAGPSGWRLGFLVGLVLPALVAGAGQPEFTGGAGWLAASGLLVGLGTQLGSGCTSGHGICGLSNGSTRSLAATLVFMAAAMLTVLVVRHAVPA